jgi:high-affinity iron transporter
MLQILVITMREGIEAFLIVAITAGILRQTGRAALLPALYWGTGIAVAVSFVASYFFSEAENKPLWEGLLALAAAIMVISMTVYMWKTARTMRTTIGKRIDEATKNKVTAAAWWGVFVFVLLMIVREGMETALLLSTLFLQQGERDLLLGAIGGVAAAALIAWAWTRQAIHPSDTA